MPLKRRPRASTDGERCRHWRQLNVGEHKTVAQIPSTTIPEPPRDPRFDPRCTGSYDVRHFIKNYGFVHELRRDEVKQLERALKRETDADKKKQIKKTIASMRNKLRALEDEGKKLELVQQLRHSSNPAGTSATTSNNQEPAQAQGRAHRHTHKYRNVQKSVVKKSLIVNKFKELKESGKLNKYLERKRKRLIHKDGNL